MKDNKGFTLIELLAVIVILAVVMLMAVTSVAPVVTRARKSALSSEGVTLVNAAKTAFQEQLVNEKDIKLNSDVCFTLEYLNSLNYYDKGLNEGYDGSVLIVYDNGNYYYYFWITNKEYAYFGVNANSFDIDKAYKYDSNESYNSCSLSNKTAPSADTTSDYDFKCIKNGSELECLAV